MVSIYNKVLRLQVATRTYEFYLEKSNSEYIYMYINGI